MHKLTVEMQRCQQLIYAPNLEGSFLQLESSISFYKNHVNKKKQEICQIMFEDRKAAIKPYEDKCSSLGSKE